MGRHVFTKSDLLSKNEGPLFIGSMPLGPIGRELVILPNDVPKKWVKGQFHFPARNCLAHHHAPLPGVIGSSSRFEINNYIVSRILYLFLKVSSSLSFTEVGHNEAPPNIVIYGALLHHPYAMRSYHYVPDPLSWN